MTLSLASISIYPLKSGAGLALSCASVGPRGLAHDRRWMLVDADRRFVTGRQLPQLVLLRARPDAHGLMLAASGHGNLRVDLPAPDAPRMRVTIWNDQVDAVALGDPADSWISKVLGRPLHLVHMDDAARRPIDPNYASSGDEVSFADGFPLLLISQASLDGLNARLAQAVTMSRFRPNLVINGTTPHAEDQWRQIRIGAIDFDLVKPCTRCIFTTVDPEHGTFDPEREPLKTLREYRRTPKGVTFGQNLIARGQGSLRTGDEVQIAAS